MAFYTLIGDGTISPTFYADYTPPTSGSPIPLQDSLNPNSVNYMHFAVDAPFDCYVPVQDSNGHVVLVNGRASQNHYTYNERIFDSAPRKWLLALTLAGRISYSIGRHVLQPYEKITIPSDVPTTDYHLYATACVSGQSTTPVAQPNDFTDWRLITVRTANAGEAAVPFFDLTALRKQTEILSPTPRVGFMTHPAFFANYPTNLSNDGRDSTNQALIVALGRSINPVDKGPVSVLDTGKDGEHSDPTSPCFACHATLDPMRLIVTRNWTYGYARQTNKTNLAFAPIFSFAGVTAPITTNDDWAAALIGHPLYAGAWCKSSATTSTPRHR